MDMELHRIKDEIMQITTPGQVEIPEFNFKFENSGNRYCQNWQNSGCERSKRIAKNFGCI